MKISSRFGLIICLILTLIELSICLEYEVKAIYNHDDNSLNFEGKKYFLEVDHNSRASSDNFGFIMFMIGLLTIFSGAMSGLTVGYLSIDDLVLELKSTTGTNLEKKYSEKILPIINQRHWLLVTLLICNASAMEALPIFLNKLVDEYMAVMISVTLVLFFGEIIPQALCTGPSQLQIAYFMAPFTKFLMYITFPFSYPIALLLDNLVGKHSKSRFVNTDLKGLIELHTLEALAKLSNEEGRFTHHEELGLHNEQKDLMISAIEIKERKIIEIMIPISKVFMIDYDQDLDRLQLNLILDKGYSRIPVFQSDRNNVIGLLRIKQLIGIDISQNKSLRNLGLKLSPPIIVHPTTPALEVLSEFKKGKSHMAFVTEQVKEYQKKFGLDEANSLIDNNNFVSKQMRTNKEHKSKIMGIVTLEDIIEKMINIDILDEDDYRKTKTLHPKVGGKNNKTKFYKEAISRQLAKSFLRDGRFNSLIENSYTAQTSQSILGIYEINSKNLPEPSYTENIYNDPTLNNSLQQPLMDKNNIFV